MFVADHFDGDASMSVLFDQLMLSDLKDKVKRIDKKYVHTYPIHKLSNSCG